MIDAVLAENIRHSADSREANRKLEPVLAAKLAQRRHVQHAGTKRLWRSRSRSARVHRHADSRRQSRWRRRLVHDDWQHHQLAQCITVEPLGRGNLRHQPRGNHLWRNRTLWPGNSRRRESPVLPGVGLTAAAATSRNGFPEAAC